MPGFRQPVSQQKKISMKKIFRVVAVKPYLRSYSLVKLEPSTPEELREDKQSLDKDDLEIFLKAINEPVQPTPIGPNKQRALKISSSYLQKISTKFEQVDSHLEEKTANNSLAPSPTLINITEIIHVNAKTKRPVEAQLAFDSLKKLNIKPDLVAYNHLMDAYASSKNYDAAIKVFEDIKKAGLDYDLVSYSTLIKVCVANEDVDAAYKLYIDMKNRKIYPNQIIFTQLIQACLRANQVDRAWKTFDHLREIDQPDSLTYSIMIGAAAKTSNAEKALDLFQEMSGYNIPANSATFNNLIRACGRRSDYYLESFSLLEQMLAAGFKPNIYTYRTLIEISASNNDFQRGRIIWNDYASRIQESNLNVDVNLYPEDPPLKPDTIFISQMLKLYNHAYEYPEKSNLEPEVPVGVDQLDLAKIDLTCNYIPRLDTKKICTREDIANEADLVWNLAVDLVSKGYVQMSTELLNRRLYFLTLNRSREGVQKSMEFFRESTKLYQLPLHIKSFKPILHQLKNSSLFKDLGIPFFKELIAWDAEMENCMPVNLTLLEKEEIRAKSGRAKKDMQDCFLVAAHGMLNSKDLAGAIDFLKQSRDFRNTYFLPPIQLKSISAILKEAQRIADFGDLEPLKTVKDLCPMVTQDPLAQVQAILRQKNVPTKWWGFKALGVSGPEKIALLRKNKRENAKIMQREMTFRKKGLAHQQNKLDKPKVFRGFIDEPTLPKNE